MHDARMLDTSGLYVDLAQFAFSPAGQEMCIYGDLAYPLRTHLQCPFRHGVLTRQMEEFNASMSSVRTSVEWFVWRPYKLFQVSRLQKKSQNWP